MKFFNFHLMPYSAGRPRCDRAQRFGLGDVLEPAL